MASWTLNAANDREATLSDPNSSPAMLARIESEPCFTLAHIREYLAVAEADLATTSEIIDAARSYAIKSVRGKLRKVRA